MLSEGCGIKALAISDLPIDVDWIGVRWSVNDLERLAGFVALAAMGQAARAASIIANLANVQTPFHPAQLVEEAVIRLTIGGKTGGVRSGYPQSHRDGFIFEVVSWVATHERYGSRAVIKDPHTSATSQGIDGLMLIVSADGSSIEFSTICEDKCTASPRETFLKNVMPTFHDRHTHKRSSELVALATDLLQRSGLSPEDASIAAESVLDLSKRKYQAAFAVDASLDTDDKRKELFAGYEALGMIGRDQRIGACFVVEQDVRLWFQQLSMRAIKFLNELNP